jgi:hypothetical protein
MSGFLSGGWNFVIAAYALTALILGGYTIHVVREFRR